MSRLCQFLALTAWSLWLGGLVLLFVIVQTLFNAEPHDIFIEVAPRIFLAFERYQLLLAGLALLGTFGWRLANPSIGISAVFTLFAAATIGALSSTMFITPHLEDLRLHDQLSSPQFARLHGLSMLVYSAQVLLLTVAGFVATGQMRPAPRQRAIETAPASAPPAEPPPPDAGMQ
jgi:uncharacterized protein DUF4149